MENKNVFIAIALSISVLLFWSTLFPTPEPTQKNITSQIKKKDNLVENNITPNINEIVEIQSVTRKQAIDKNERIKIENNNIKGSILLKGGVIDDVSFKNHKQNIKDKENIIFLNPRDTENG